MARTIEQIKQTITANLQADFSLSTSVVAEWRMWVHAASYAIYAFEVILDVFKKEMDNKANTEVPGSLTWYSEMCYRFQYGHELLFNRTTAQLYYAVDDPAARIIAIASVKEVERTLLFKVAKKDEESAIVPLSDVQLLNFKNYIESIKFAGSKTEVVSTEPDIIRYDVRVFYDPAMPTPTLEEAINTSLDSFRTEQWFGGMIYSQGFIDAIMRVPGVITVQLVALERKGTHDPRFVPVGVRSDLYAGYFNYAEEGNTMVLTSINDLF